jgi:hypothetical protein
VDFVVFLKIIVAFLHCVVVLCSRAMTVALLPNPNFYQLLKGNIMTKKLLSTAIGMILAGGVGVAQADVQLFGQIDESLIYVKGGEISSDDPIQMVKLLQWRPRDCCSCLRGRKQYPTGVYRLPDRRQGQRRPGQRPEGAVLPGLGV